MLHIRKVLYATDFSEASQHAFSWALWTAAAYGAELHMLHAIVLHEADPADPTHHFPEPERVFDELRKYADARMKATVEEAVAGELHIERVQLRGIAPAPVILDYAAKNDIDIIVIGTHGRRGLRHMVLGSVAEEVARTSGCPVLVVRQDDELEPKPRIDRIVVPMDLSAHADLGLAYSKEIAAVAKASLEIIHVLPVGAYPDYLVSLSVHEMLDQTGLQQHAVRFLEERLESVEGPHAPAGVTVVAGHPVDEIARFAEDRRADLVVLASHGRSGLEHMLLGSVAEGVMRSAHCPVLIVKAFGKDLLQARIARE